MINFLETFSRLWILFYDQNPFTWSRTTLMIKLTPSTVKPPTSNKYFEKLTSYHLVKSLFSFFLYPVYSKPGPYSDANFEFRRFSTVLTEYKNWKCRKCAIHSLNLYINELITNTSSSHKSKETLWIHYFVATIIQVCC